MARAVIGIAATRADPDPSKLLRLSSKKRTLRVLLDWVAAIAAVW
jgi:hypothetical protein